MTELFIPPKNAIIPKDSTFYKATETFQNRSRANRERAVRYWSDPRNHEKVATNAKPIAAYRLDGTFVGWWPSSRKAAQALFDGDPKHSNERNIRSAVTGKNSKKTKKSHHGFMFRDWTGCTADIAPYAVNPHRTRKGYTKPYNRDNSYLMKPTRATFPDGDTLDFHSVTDCAQAFGVKPNVVSIWVRKAKPHNGILFQFIENQ